MEYPTCSSDSNPIEHVCNTLVRRIAGRPMQPSIATFVLIEEGNMISESLIDNATENRENMCTTVSPANCYIKNHSSSSNSPFRSFTGIQIGDFETVLTLTSFQGVLILNDF